jgi:tetratricopeptide (TPR) repeat protein
MILLDSGYVGGRRPQPPARSAACLAAALLLSPLAARAETPARDAVAAEALFRAGRDLVAAGHYAEGCPKFEASFALDPSAGTLLNLAKCHEHDGAIATAWEEYSRALVLSRETQGAERQRALAGVAAKGIASLESRLPKLRIAVVLAPVASPPPPLEVKRDGQPMPAATLGEALPVNPGQHQVSASAPGYRTQTRVVKLEEGQTTTVEITLAPEIGPQQAAVPVWPWVTGAVGVALAGASAYFAADDLSAIHALRANCQSNAKGTFCAPGYDVARDNARKDRDFPLFVGLGGAGVAAVGTAIVGIVLRPRSRSEASAGFQLTPWVGPAGAGAAASGRF